MNYKTKTLVLAIFTLTGTAFAQEMGLPLEAVDLPTIPTMDLFAKLTVWVIAVNMVLSGIANGLNKIKDLTATKVDNKISDALNKVVSFLGSILDFASANVSHTKTGKK